MKRSIFILTICLLFSCTRDRKECHNNVFKNAINETCIEGKWDYRWSSGWGGVVFPHREKGEFYGYFYRRKLFTGTSVYHNATWLSGWRVRKYKEGQLMPVSYYYIKQVANSKLLLKTKSNDTGLNDNTREKDEYEYYYYSNDSLKAIMYNVVSYWRAWPEIDTLFVVRFDSVTRRIQLTDSSAGRCRYDSLTRTISPLEPWPVDEDPLAGMLDSK